MLRRRNYVTPRSRLRASLLLTISGISCKLTGILRLLEAQLLSQILERFLHQAFLKRTREWWHVLGSHDTRTVT